MHFTSLFLATLGAVSASALPSGQSSPCNAASPGNTFGLVAIRSGSPVQYAGFNAALSSLFAGLPSQNASCDCTDTGYATFYLNNGGLFLYAESATPQQFFVDRSGMGQGIIGYTTGAQPAPKNSERTGWAIDSLGHLQFAGNDLIACPNSIDGAWSIWAPAGVQNPAGNENCVGISARVMEDSNPNGCLYTQ